MTGWQQQKFLHSTAKKQTYPQAKEQIKLDTRTLTLCNSALYDLINKEKHETHLSTICNQKKTYPWFSGAHENTGWPRCYQCTPRQGSRQTCRLAYLPQSPEIRRASGRGRGE